VFSGCCTELTTETKPDDRGNYSLKKQEDDERNANRGVLVSLSELQRFTLRDERQQIAPLADLVVGLSMAECPQVTRLIYREKKLAPRALSWQAVSGFDWKKRQIIVADLSQGTEVSAERERHSVWLRRDVLDALILDLKNRQTTRANDLWLKLDARRLCLQAVEIGLRSILRRLGLSRLRLPNEKTLCNWDDLEFLRGDPDAASRWERLEEGYHLRIVMLPAGEIAQFVASLPYPHAVELLLLLPDPQAADVLEALPLEKQLQVFEELPEERALQLLELSAPDAAADLLGQVDHSQAKHYLEHLSAKQRERVIELLRYPEDSVGGIMTNDLVCAPERLTIAEARRSLRERLKEPDFINFIYAVNNEEEKLLRGVLSVRLLLTAEDEQPLREVMDPCVTVLNPLEPAAGAAWRLINSNLAGLPVVGNNGQLLGVVTVDAAFSQVAPATWRDQLPKVFS
jgi:magnesium transporter